MWSDSWTQVASTGRTLTSPPPPKMRDCTLVLETRDSLPADWASLVGTSFSSNIIYVRLESCIIPCLYRDSVLVGTCVLRPHPDLYAVYALETLVAKKGHQYGSLVLHAATYAMYQDVGPHTLVFVWELTASQMIKAYLKGWLKTKIRVEYGWMYTSDSEHTIDLRLPKKIDGITYSASGIDDIVYCNPGTVDPIRAKKIWCIASTCPGKGWTWTGEYIVTGNLNAATPIQRWGTAEIASY